MFIKKWFDDKNIKIKEIILNDINELPDTYNMTECLPLLVVNKNTIGNYMDLIRQESYIKFLIGIQDKTPV